MQIRMLGNEIEWRIGWAWTKSSKLNDRKMNVVDKITKLTGKTYNIGFPGQFRRFVIPFDEGVIQIREINLGHEIRSSNVYFGHSNSHFGQEI